MTGAGKAGERRLPEAIERWIGICAPFLEAHEAGLWLYWPTEKEIILCARPVLNVSNDRLHHAIEPSVWWPGGAAFYFWRGVQIPERYYCLHVTAREIIAEANIEVRRAMMERYDELRGKGAFISDVGVKVIDSAVQPMRKGQRPCINELLRIDLPGDPDEVMVALKVIDPSTGRVYIIRVPPTQKKVKSALAWTFGVKAADYILQQES